MGSLEVNVVRLAVELLQPTPHARVDPLAGWRAHGMIATYSKVANMLTGSGVAVIPRNVSEGCLKLIGVEAAFKEKLLLQFAPKIQRVRDRLQQRLRRSVEHEAYPALLMRDSFIAHLAVVCHMLSKHSPARTMT
eukprot:6489503-Amphidinium_carterae.1